MCLHIYRNWKVIPGFYYIILLYFILFCLFLSYLKRRPTNPTDEGSSFPISWLLKDPSSNTIILKVRISICEFRIQIFSRKWKTCELSQISYIIKVKGSIQVDRQWFSMFKTIRHELNRGFTEKLPSQLLPSFPKFNKLQTVSEYG